MSGCQLLRLTRQTQLSLHLHTHSEFVRIIACLPVRISNVCSTEAPSAIAYYSYIVPRPSCFSPILHASAHTVTGSYSPAPKLCSSQSGQATLLNLGQGSAATQESNKTNHRSCWQGLEKVPACIVHEEDALHSQYGAVEKPMRHRRIT